ncbi:MAG: bacteriohemerythrin [Proteobacteria bacterium]|nr:bacteriohemerythrin [Pseudomonadota bacterium]MBU1611550.1 bacteriohemerythrin [Pseudomonadota bacterium]
MSFLEWNDDHKVGVKEVDEQHQKLFDMLNDLHQAAVNGSEQSVLAAILDEMIDYTVYHFKTEEDLYIKYNFPGYENHKKVHDALTGQAVELQQQFRDGSATISFDLLDFLHGWLVDHTTGLDKEMGPFLNEKGVY